MEDRLVLLPLAKSRRSCPDVAPDFAFLLLPSFLCSEAQSEERAQ